MSTQHIPILVEPILQALIEPFLKLPPSSPPVYWVDCTLGGGGHTRSFLDLLAQNPLLTHHKVIALDQDEAAVQKAHLRFESEIKAGQLTLFHMHFKDLEKILTNYPVQSVMADLGFSSDQIQDGKRGLSFQSPGPLDMRLDPSQGISCEELLQTLPESELERILREYGEERFSRRIASSIVQLRQKGIPLQTTQDLVLAIVKALPASARHGRIHAATRSFQALRIAVNHELEELDELLFQLKSKLSPGARAAILTFHSLEDRRVKQCFNKDPSHFTPLSKKPIVAGEEEIAMNPRSRSAKLRLAERK